MHANSDYPKRIIFSNIEKFNMAKVKPVTTFLAGHFKLSSNQCLNTQEEEDEMSRSHASTVGSLMYSMICTRPDLAYAISTVSQFMSNPGKQYWEAVKWVLQYLRGTARLGLVF